jgi:hypothetical protein
MNEIESAEAELMRGAPKSESDPLAVSVRRMSVPGTFRTWRDVRLESVMRTKADVRQRLRIHEFAP